MRKCKRFFSSRLIAFSAFFFWFPFLPFFIVYISLISYFVHYGFGDFLFDLASNLWFFPLLYRLFRCFCSIFLFKIDYFPPSFCLFSIFSLLSFYTFGIMSWITAYKKKNLLKKISREKVLKMRCKCIVHRALNVAIVNHSAEQEISEWRAHAASNKENE